MKKYLFIAENIKNFKCGKGWHDLIKSLLSELYDADWPASDQVYGKGKFGALRVSFNVNGANTIWLNIYRKYAAMAEKVCDVCGEHGQHRTINGWEKTLCTKHFMETYPVIEIKRISFNKVFRIEFKHGYDCTNFYTRGFLALGNESLYITGNHRQLNYYALLKAIPTNKLEENDRAYIERFFSSLTACPICGYKAVFDYRCHYCWNQMWIEDVNGKWPNDSMFYQTEILYVKEMQMEWMLDSDDFRKLKIYKEVAFERVQSHSQTFTDEEFQEYVGEQNGYQDL